MKSTELNQSRFTRPPDNYTSATYSRVAFLWQTIVPKHDVVCTRDENQIRIIWTVSLMALLQTAAPHATVSFPPSERLCLSEI